MALTQDELKLNLEKVLGEEITKLTLKGKGYCNNAYYIETVTGGRYIVKEELEGEKINELNSLVIEGRLIQQLNGLDLSVPVPNVVFVSEELKMYGYESIEGDMMREVWGSLSEQERVEICRMLGVFHAEIGMKFTKEMAIAVGVGINNNVGLHPEVVKEYDRLSVDSKVPEDFRNLVKEAWAIFDTTLDQVVFQFIHNDSHHENIIIKDKKISGIIDFGDAMYGEVAKEFSRYIRDFPDYFEYIVLSYEEASGNKLSRARLVSNALVSGFIDIVENYQKGGDNRTQAENAIVKYRQLLAKVK
jgi:hypothetical protein